MKRKKTSPRLAAFAGVLLAFVFFPASCQKKEASLSLLVWEGYADPSFVHAFEEAHHCKVSASYMGSSDDLVAKLRGGYNIHTRWVGAKARKLLERP
jgi:spermidine/putrescine-binding protein